jgi:hypothetical protein
MRVKKETYRPCSDLDIRSAALRATHERLKAMDDAGEHTVGKFGDLLREERAKFKAYGIYQDSKGTCPTMTWEDYKQAVNQHAKTAQKSKKAG